MKLKKLKNLLGVALAASLAVCSMSAFAEETTADDEETLVVEDSQGDEEEVVIDEDSEEETKEEETETETETSDFIEGSALLSDYDYEAGEIDEDGWTSEYLNLMYTPDDEAGISMGLEENEQLKEYHERNGEDKQVSANEMVALDENDGYVQLMVEVNPNHESEESLLERFTDNEELELISVERDYEIGGRTFLARTGVYDSEKYMIGVCTEEEDIVMAVKVKYENTSARKDLLAGFEPIEVEEEETEDEEESEIESEITEIIDEEIEDESEEETDDLLVIIED